MHNKKDEMPILSQISRGADWGEMAVGFVNLSAGTDTRPILKGLPNDSCQCPHWGYLFKGRMRVIYADHEEVINAEEVYYLPPGHNLIAEEDCEYVEFSPKDEVQLLKESIARIREAEQRGE